MDLTALNDRWRENNHPYAMQIAVPDIGHSGQNMRYLPHCPRCGETGVIPLPLHAAMSDALAHKQKCGQVN